MGFHIKKRRRGLIMPHIGAGAGPGGAPQRPAKSPKTNDTRSKNPRVTALKKEAQTLKDTRATDATRPPITTAPTSQLEHPTVTALKKEAQTLKDTRKTDDTRPQSAELA